LIINFESDPEDLRKHLKDKYSLGCKFERPKANKPKPVKKKDLKISSETSISELDIFSIDVWFKSLTVFNSDGNRIPPDLTLREAKNFKIEYDENHEFNNLLNSLNAISETSDYSDIEWIKRISSKALKISLNETDKNKVLLVLDKILKNNEKFFQSDLDAILKK
tara:strand:+ start:59 stop:553 length:495 start_codon:yes stop_codon:yes gene_type:complete